MSLICTRFNTNLNILTHHCSMYDMVGKLALFTLRLNYWHITLFNRQFLTFFLHTYVVLYFHRTCLAFVVE